MTNTEFQQIISKRLKPSTGFIKKILYKNKLKEVKCEGCGLTNIYNKKPIVLQLHHKDGNNSNNILENFEILCPNCHSQTPTFRSKKKIEESDILEAAKNSKTISEIITKLGKHPSGDLYKKIERVIDTHEVPIKKYEYRANNAKQGGRSRKKETKNITTVCSNCKLNQTKNRYAKYCCRKCANEAAVKYDIDVLAAIEKVRELGWSAAAKLFNFKDAKYPDVALRVLVKGYIKRNNLNINFYELSKYAHHTREDVKKN